MIVEMLQALIPLVEFAISLNVKRRHLTSSQLAVVALGVEKQLGKEAAQRQVKAGGDKYSVEPHPEKFQDAVLAEKGESAQIAAKMLNTNQNYVVNAKKIEERAPELLEHVLAMIVEMLQALRQKCNNCTIPPLSSLAMIVEMLQCYHASQRHFTSSTAYTRNASLQIDRWTMGQRNACESITRCKERESPCPETVGRL